MDTPELDSGIRILKPPKVYLDTNHLVNIARARRGKSLPPGQSISAYLSLDASIRTGLCGIIYNVAAPLEWVGRQATRETANEVAEVIDAARLVYLYERDRFIWTIELLHECNRANSAIRIPDLDSLQAVAPGKAFRSAQATLANHVPGYLDPGDLPEHLRGLASLQESWTFAGVRSAVEEAFRFKSNHPATYKERIDGYEAALLGDIEQAPPGLRLGSDDMLAWAKRHLKADAILAAYNPGLDVDAVLNAIDFNRCPAITLWFRAREQRIKAKHGPRESEGDDWSILPIVPYADLVVVDRGFRDSLLRADRGLASRVIVDAEDAADRMCR